MIKGLNFLLLLCAWAGPLGLVPSAQAEYRAFLLRIEKRENPEAYREVISNLDPRQYRDLFPVKSDERVTYTDTWMCRGRTHGFKPICPRPEREVASQDPNPQTP